MCKILLVDDESIERIVLRKFLSKVDSITLIEEADSGRSALEKFEEMNPDIVIMDIKMPGIDGIEAAKRIKKMRSDCVIIYLSAYIEAEKIHDCLFSGGEAYLQKPVREHELINVINRFKAAEKTKEKAPDYDKMLIENILDKNYKASKEALNTLMDSRKNTAGSFQDLKSVCKSTAEAILGALEQMDMKSKGNLGGTPELMAEVSAASDPYALRLWLFRVLDFVFSAVVQERRGFQDDEINVVLNYIEKNYYKKVTLEEVADYISISPFYLSKLFKKHTGENFIDYLTDLKIKKAKELLEFTDIPVINIAMELSFNEPNYFTRVFRKTAGMTPSAYRESRREAGTAASRIKDARWYV